MTPVTIDEVLAQTLADRRLSGSERDALRQLLEQNGYNQQALDTVRARAFDLVRQHVSDPQTAELLKWLEDVVKQLRPIGVAKSAGPPARAAAMFSPGDDCTGQIIRLFQNCRQSADVCVFTITDDRIRNAILDAHRRGVAVRVITDNDKANDLGSDIYELEQAGVAVRMDRTPFHMHHKYAIFDGEHLLNGSFNWTRGAARDNQENIVVCGDPALVAAFAKAFEKLWGQLA